MTRLIKDQCVYLCGPYESYFGKAAYDDEAETFHGEVVGVRDVVTFQGRSPAELRRAFRASVDDYLKYCASRSESPEKPFSGKFVTRLDPDLHRKLSALAELSGKSLNQFICECLRPIADGSPAPSRKSASDRPRSSRRKNGGSKRRRRAAGGKGERQGV